MTLKVLSVKQPWALAICRGKDVENRSRATTARGLIAIHASKSFDDVATATLLWIADLIEMTPRQATQHDHRGAVVAVAHITGCHRHGDPRVPCGTGDTPTCSVWATRDAWHWCLTEVHPLETPVPARGALGLWRLPTDVDTAVRAQLAQSGAAPTAAQQAARGA